MTDEIKPKRTYNRRDDKTPAQSTQRRNERTRKREALLTARAIEFGFASKSAMLTAIASGAAIVTKVDKS